MPGVVNASDANQVPSLMSLIIEGLPPREQSKYFHEAETLLAHYTSRWPHIPSFKSYCRLGLSMSSYVFPGAIDADRLATSGIHFGCLWLLDDIFYSYDVQSNESLAKEIGVDPSVFHSPSRIQEYCDHVMAVHAQQARPGAPVEVIMGELGHHILQLSNPEWFEAFNASLRLYLRATADSHAEIRSGKNSCVQDLELYTVMRAKNVGGAYIQLFSEFTSNVYLPCELRTHPIMQKLFDAVSVHLGFANDIYSFPKESANEGALNPHSLVTLFMRSGGLSVVEAIHAAIALTNKHARIVVDFETGAWTPALQQYMQDVKAVIAGNVYMGCVNKRYARPDSIFLEHRVACVCSKNEQTLKDSGSIMAH